MISQAPGECSYNLHDSAAHREPVRRQTASFRQEGEDGERTLEELVRLAAKPIAYIGGAVIFLGLIYLGMNLRDGARGGGGELRKAIAMIAAGAAVTGFAALYGFTGF